LAIYQSVHKLTVKTDQLQNISGDKHRQWIQRKILTLKILRYYYNHFTALWTLSGTTRVSRYQKGKTNGFTGVRDSEWRWNQLGHMQIFTSHQHNSIPPLSFLQAWCPSCHPTNSVKALKACILRC